MSYPTPKDSVVRTETEKRQSVVVMFAKVSVRGMGTCVRAYVLDARAPVYGCLHGEPAQT